MPAADFLDTNILVYAYDASDPRKQSIAQELTRRALAGEFLISIQVLSELASTLLHKISPPATAEQLVSILDALAPSRPSLQTKKPSAALSPPTVPMDSIFTMP